MHVLYPLELIRARHATYAAELYALNGGHHSADLAMNSGRKVVITVYQHLPQHLHRITA
jgi:hypothetical protein